MAASKPVKPTKLPLRVIQSDDYVVTIDGVDYRPHAGETVSFRVRVSPNDMLRAAAIQSDFNSNDADELAARLDEIRAFLAGRIVQWTWTDDDGEPYQSPPTAEVLNTLDIGELGWLMANVLPGRDSDRGEDSTPST